MSLSQKQIAVIKKYADKDFAEPGSTRILASKGMAVGVVSAALFSVFEKQDIDKVDMSLCSIAAYMALISYSWGKKAKTEFNAQTTKLKNEDIVTSPKVVLKTLAIINARIDGTDRLLSGKSKALKGKSKPKGAVKEKLELMKARMESDRKILMSAIKVQPSKPGVPKK